MLPTLFAVLQDPAATRVILERTWLDQFALIGQSLVSILVLVLLVAATFTMLALRKALDELTRLVRSTSSDITAAVHDAREVADELRRLSGRVRDTADIVGAGIRKVRDRGERRDRGDRPPRPERSERPERSASAAPSDTDEAEDSDPQGERAERPERTERERSERRRRKRRRGGDRPRPSEGGAPPGAANGDTPSE